MLAHEEQHEPIPAWSLPADSIDRIRLVNEWPERVSREWAIGGATGAGIKVCVLDSGIEADHPLVGQVDEAVAVGISQNYLSEIENGRRKGPAELQMKFARALGVPIDLLID